MRTVSCKAYLVPALVAVLTAFAASASAQRAQGPFSGILGGSDPDATHTLDLRGSLFGAWDDTLSRVEGDTPVDERFLRSGGAGGASGSIAHNRRSSRLDWQSSAASSIRLYGAGSEKRAATFNGQSALSSNVSRRISLSGSGVFRYAPYYDFAPGLDGRLSNLAAFGGGFGLATEAQRNVAATGGAGMSVRLSRRSTFDVSGSVQEQRFLDQDDTKVHGWGAGATFSHQLSRAMTFHAGFTRNDARYTANSAPITSNNVDVGVTYGDTLRFDRRTSLTFGSSTSALRWNDNTYFRLNGSVALTRGFGRSGSGALQYQRDTDFNGAFREPLLRDMVSGGVSNQLGRRASWSLQAGYSRSNIGFGPDARHVNALSGSAGVNVAVTRRISVFTDYGIYRYEVPPGATVFSSLERFSRHSVTAGLSLWAPLISDKRSTRDTR